MKKSYKLILSIILVVPVITGFSQSLILKSELPASRFEVEATVMDNDTWCQVTWPDPANPWEIWYDDGVADDYFVYNNPGSLNATKFIPMGHPFLVTGGRIHVGDGSFPGPFLGTSFRVLVYDDDGEDGFPGTALDSIDVTVNNYEWVEFEGMTAEIADGNFYLAMKQLAPAPNAAPIGVDTDNPTYFNSYSYFVGAPGWVLSPLQDFMIRAWISGYNEPARAIESFEVARFSGFDFNGSPLLGDTTVLDTLELSEYADHDWDTLDPGLYAYGVRTHFSGGEWSDYDVSNLVTHIFYPFPPACFYQADPGNQLLIICPPAGLNGEVPNFFIGFNLYIEGEFISFLPPSTTEYLIELPDPGIYSCWLTAVYELPLPGYKDETVESSAIYTDYIKRFGTPLPFLEQWIYGNFETNNWQPEGENWSLTGQEGNPIPCAQFTWDPIQTDYAIALDSYPFLADSMTEGQIYLDFDIKLDNINTTGNEQMLVQVWNWDSRTWTTVNTYSNEDGSFDWGSEHLDITDQAMETVFKIRFLAAGDNSLDILGWYVDNINIYRSCISPMPTNLVAYGSYQYQGIVLEWEQPYQTDEWIHWDNGINSGNSIGGPLVFDVAARWEPEQLTQYEGSELKEIAFVPCEEASTYNIRVWIGSGDPVMVVDQPVENPVIGQWNIIVLDNPLPIDISQELWIGYHIDCETGYPAGVDDGPAIDGYGNMLHFGEWNTMLEINPELDYNWSIKANIHQTQNLNPELFAIYRSDDFNNEWFFRDYADTNFYVDDSVCGPGIYYHTYKVSGLYINGPDTCESGFSNEADEICIGLKENKNENFIKIYPNPASDVLFIESSERLESVCVFDSRGGMVEQWKGGKVVWWYGGKVEIPVGGLAPGLYLVRVDLGEVMINRKIIVKH